MHLDIVLSSEYSASAIDIVIIRLFINNNNVLFSLLS